MVGVGYMYDRLHSFVTRYRHIPISLPTTKHDAQVNTSSINGGLYLLALCDGIDELLQCYRSAILAMEHAILSQQVHHTHNTHTITIVGDPNNYLISYVKIERAYT
jgi:hypothetical protein